MKINNIRYINYIVTNFKLYKNYKYFFKIWWYLKIKINITTFVIYHTKLFA